MLDTPYRMSNTYERSGRHRPDSFVTRPVPLSRSRSHWPLTCGRSCAILINSKMRF